MPVDCSLVTIKLLGPVASPLEDLVRTEIGAGHPYAEDALRAIIGAGMAMLSRDSSYVDRD